MSYPPRYAKKLQPLVNVGSVLTRHHAARHHSQAIEMSPWPTHCKDPDDSCGKIPLQFESNHDARAGTPDRLGYRNDQDSVKTVNVNVFQ